MIRSSRARLRSLAAVLFFALLAMAAATPAPAQDGGVLSRDSVLRDKEIPPLGNPQGDVTIVEYFDYQCPYCRTIAPQLAAVMKEDGNIRLVLKDWPVFGAQSEYAARLALAARYQDKFAEAHRALIGATRRLTESSARALLTSAGIDVAKAEADLATNRKAIDALLARNNAQAEAFGFPGTPAFIVGTFRVPGVPTPEQFKQMIADVRAGRDQSGKD